MWFFFCKLKVFLGFDDLIVVFLSFGCELWICFYEYVEIGVFLGKRWGLFVCSEEY